MRFQHVRLFAALVVALAVAPAFAQSLSNPSFEDPITFDGPPFVGSWEGFNAGPGSFAANNDIMPRTGGLHLLLAIDNVENSFAGVFQDVPGLVAGSLGTFSGWHKAGSSPLDLGIEARIEWRNSVTNSEVGRTPNMTIAPTGDYTLFQVAGIVPGGADTARVVYAVQTFGPEPTNTGRVYVDDVAFVVPEPTCVSLLGIACCGLAFIRRR